MNVGLLVEDGIVTALSTYDELKASIADFLNRDDLTSVIPDLNLLKLYE